MRLAGQQGRQPRPLCISQERAVCMPGLLLQTLVQPTQTTEPAPIRPTLTTIQELAGSLRAPADFDYKRELNEWRDEKFGG